MKLPGVVKLALAEVFSSLGQLVRVPKPQVRMGEENMDDNIHLSRPHPNRILSLTSPFYRASIFPNTIKKG